MQQVPTDFVTGEHYFIGRLQSPFNSFDEASPERCYN
jgi:hypothetical protein